MRLGYFHCIIKEIPTKVYHHIKSLKQRFISNFRLTSKLQLLAVLHRVVLEFIWTDKSLNLEMYGLIKTHGNHKIRGIPIVSSGYYLK